MGTLKQRRPRRALLAVLTSLGACDGGATAVDPTPRIEYVAVDGTAGASGVTAIAWSHPSGASALDRASAGALFSGTSSSGTPEVRGRFPSSNQDLPNGIVEFRFNDGRNVTSIDASIQDVHGRWSVYRCQHPAWQCVIRPELSHPNRPT